MAQETQQTKRSPNWVLLFAVFSFFFGFAINGFLNYMSYTTKVDLLTANVGQLTQIIGEMNKKIDDGNIKYFDLDKRLSILENDKTDKKN